MAGPSSDAIYQALAAAKTTASPIVHYQTENGYAANITKQFVFTVRIGYYILVSLHPLGVIKG
jgi:hypothetical protein